MHYTPLSGYSLPERNPSNPPVRAPLMSAFTTISPVTGELMVPGNSGVVIQADSGKEAIRVGGTAMTSNMTLPGFDTSLNQIQFYSNGNMVSAFDQNGLYFPNSKSVFIGNQTSFGQLTYSESVLSLNTKNNGTINISANGTGVIHFLTNGSSKANITENTFTCLNLKSNNQWMLGNGTNSFYFTDNEWNGTGSPTGTNCYGRLFGTSNGSSMVFDYFNSFQFRETNATGQTVLNNSFSIVNAGGNRQINYNTNEINVQAGLGPCYTRYLNGSTLYFYRPDNQNIWSMFVNSSSQFVINNPAGGASAIMNNNSGTWVNNSDRRLKENINDIKNGLDIISQLQPVHYKYIKQTDDVVQTGFIANDVQQVLPNAVHDVENGMLGLDQMHILPYAVQAIKELNEKIEKQSQLIALLMAKIESRQ
jgi:hypothetical protein